MKTRNRLFSFGLAFALVFSLSAAVLPVSAESVDLTDTSKYECVGSLNENFDGLADVNALYQASGEGVLSGRWRLTELSAWGKGSNEIATLDGGNKVLNMTSTADWANPGGVDFMFDTPLAPEYILDISYDMHFDSSRTDTEAAALFSNGNFDNHDNAGIGRRVYGNSFQILSGNEEGKAADGTRNGWDSGTITVKAVYDLKNWTYDAEVFLDGTSAASKTGGKIGPSSWDAADTCTPGSTYEKLSFAVQVGAAYVDNVSVKAYKPKTETPPEPDIPPEEDPDCVGAMTEKFDGIADINALYRQSGDGVLSGTWQRSARGIGGSATIVDGKMSITAPDGATDWDTFSGVEFVFDKPLKPNYVLEVSYELSDGGFGSVFFNNLSDENAEISNVNSIGAGYWDGGFQFLTTNGDNGTGSGCWVWRGDDTASVKTAYNLKQWTFDGTVAMNGGGNGSVTAGRIGPAAYNDFGGTFVCTSGSKFDRLTFAIRQGTATFDNISVKAYKTESEIEPGVNIDFSDCATLEDMRQKGFLINDGEKASIGSAYEGDPMSPSLCINASYNGVNLPAFPNASYDGAFRVSYWVYNANSDARLLVDAPMVMNGWDDGSLMLLEVRDNLASITTNFDATRGSTIATLKDNKWYRFEHIIDVNARTVSAAAYDADGAKIGTTVQVDFANMTSGMSANLINHFGGIRIRNWSDLDMFMDNIQIERYFAAPSMSEYQISFAMADGTEGYGKEDINPAVESVMLNFGAKITDDSAESGIHLSKKDGTAVPFEIEVNRGKYFLKLAKFLEPNQSYTLTADKEIENEVGTTMAQTFQYTFTTGKGEFSAEIVSAQVNDSVLETMEGVPGSEALKVNIQYSNSLLDSKNIACVISYYDSNHRTIGKTIHEIEATASKAGIAKLTAKAVPENCSSIQVVLWNDLEAMIPYCDCLTLSE